MVLYIKYNSNFSSVCQYQKFGSLGISVRKCRCGNFVRAYALKLWERKDMSMHPGEDQPRRRLKVDISELAMAFDESGWEISYYLNLDTGEVVPVMDNIHRQLEGIYYKFSEEPLRNLSIRCLISTTISRTESRSLLSRYLPN